MSLPYGGPLQCKLGTDVLEFYHLTTALQQTEARVARFGS